MLDLVTGHVIRETAEEEMSDKVVYKELSKIITDKRES